MLPYTEEALYYIDHDDPRNGTTDFAVTYAILALVEEVKTLRMIIADHVGYANGGEPAPTLAADDTRDPA